MNYATEKDMTNFEAGIQRMWESGDLPCLLHLCGGNERQLVELFKEARDGDWFFSTHRNHYHALLAGITPERLRALILAGKSMFVFDRERNFVSSSILAGNCAMAVGVAYALKESGSKRKVWCFVGDGAEEEGHFYEAALYAEGHDLPITFVVEDNDRQVDTDKAARRGKELRGLEYLFPSVVRRYQYRATFPHAGSGAKPGTIVFKQTAIDRLAAAQV